VLEGWSARRFTRFSVGLPIRHRVTDPPPAGGPVGWTVNLGGGGICVECADHLRPQASLGLWLHTERGPMNAEARVVWHRDPLPTGGGNLHGLAFTDLPQEQLEILRSQLLSFRPWRHTRGRLPVHVTVTCQPRRPPGPLLWGRLSDLSRGGLLLHLPEVLPPFTDVEVTLPTPPGVVLLAGTIAWVESRERRKSGRSIRHGVRFVALDWSTALALARFLTEPTDGPHPSSSRVSTAPQP
jgi:hypothetical protein